MNIFTPKINELIKPLFNLKGYLAAFSKSDLPDDLKGKERAVFGNIKQIYEWHKT